MEENGNKDQHRNKMDNLDGIIPPVIINSNSCQQNGVVRFRNNRETEEDPELIISTDTLPTDPPPYSANDPSEDAIQPGNKGKNSCCQRIYNFILLIISNITLEPAEFLMGLAGSIAIPSWGQMTIDKACHDLGYNSTICDDVLDYDDIYEEVNHYVKYFILQCTQ